MAEGRHSFVAFYPSDWLAGTARLPRLMRSVYFDVCCYNWDTAMACPPMEVMLMVSDLPNGIELIDQLVLMGKLVRNPDGSLENRKAMSEAAKAYEAWRKMSRGGKGAAKPLDEGLGKGDDNPLGKPLGKGDGKGDGKPVGIEPEPEPEPDDSTNHGSRAPADERPPLEVWNEMAKSAGLALVKVMTDKRKSSMQARIAEHGLAAINAAIKTIPQSGFLMGEGGRGWVANFDWLVQPNSMAKLVEGGYHVQGGGRPSGWDWRQ